MKQYVGLRARKTFSVLVLVAGVASGLAGCGSGEKEAASPAKDSSATSRSGDGKPAPSVSEGVPESSAATTLAEIKGNDLSVAITSAVRDSAGFVTVSGNVRNEGARSWVGADWASDERELRANGGSLAGSSLVDQKGKKRYLILRDTNGKCLCTKFDAALRQGSSADWYAQFPAPPKETTTVTFQVGAMPPAEIPLTEAQ